MKRLIPIIFMLVLSNVILSCGNNSMKNATLQQDSAKVTFTGISNVVYAHAGADSTDTTLDVIPMGKDPIQFNDVDAKKKGDLLGFFDTGDRIAVALSNDGKQLLKAVDITSFVGRWITGDSLSDINAKGFNLNADGSSNTISHRPQDENYTNWNIVDIDLKLTVTSRRQKNALKRYDIFTVIKLQRDTLVLLNAKTQKVEKYVRYKSTDATKMMML